MKRVFLFVLTNIAILIVLSIAVRLLGLDRYLTESGISYGGLLVFAAIFVYRHTARRRKLQAFLTTLIATLLALCILILASILSARVSPTEPTQPAGPHIAA